MNKDETQEKAPQPSFSQMRGNLGFVTHLHEQLLAYKHPQQPQNTPQKPQNEPAQAPEAKLPETPQHDEMANMEGKMEAKMETLRTEMKSTITTEIDSLRQVIESALHDEKD